MYKTQLIELIKSKHEYGYNYLYRKNRKELLGILRPKVFIIPLNKYGTVIDFDKNTTHLKVGNKFVVVKNKELIYET